MGKAFAVGDSLRYFIDTNVMANWLAVSGRLKIIDKSKKTDEEKSDERKRIFSKYPKAIMCYKFMEYIKTVTDSAKHFFTSDLALCEIHSVIFELLIADKMLSDWIPPRYWGKVKEKYRKEITNEDVNELVDDFSRLKEYFFYPDVFISQEQIQFCFEDIADLIWKNGCDTHDAILVATARKIGCSFFVTVDRPLSKNLNISMIKTIPPNIALSKIKEMKYQK